MKFKQTNEQNTGIDNTQINQGYRHGDALHFKGEICDILDSYFKVLASDLIERFPKTKYVLDVGSGAGHLRRWLLEKNPKLVVVTIDGNRESINSPFVDQNTHFVVRTDMDYTIVDSKNNIIKFDLICSFEHFEHIESKYFDTFMNNIIKHSKTGTTIVASAANYEYHNSEERHIHCNVKNSEDWHNYLTTGFPLERIDKTILNENNWGYRLSSCSELIYRVK